MISSNISLRTRILCNVNRLPLLRIIVIGKEDDSALDTLYPAVDSLAWGIRHPTQRAKKDQHHQRLQSALLIHSSLCLWIVMQYTHL